MSSKGIVFLLHGQGLSERELQRREFPMNRMEKKKSSKLTTKVQNTTKKVREKNNMEREEAGEESREGHQERLR